MRIRTMGVAVAVTMGVLAAPGAAGAAVCAPGTTVCVSGVEENVAAALATAGAVKTYAEKEAAEATAGANAIVSGVIVTSGTQVRATSNAVLSPLESSAGVCSPSAAGATPVCVTGVGAQVVAAEEVACERATAQNLDQWVGFVTDRCYTAFP